MGQDGAAWPDSDPGCRRRSRSYSRLTTVCGEPDLLYRRPARITLDVEADGAGDDPGATGRRDRVFTDTSAAQRDELASVAVGGEGSHVKTQ